MADRFYGAAPPVDGRVTLSPEESRHLARVRRLGIGDQVEVFDGLGQAWHANVVSLERPGAVVQLREPIPDRAPSCELTLACAVPKGDRFDWLIEKAVELGVARLIPLIADRSVVEPRSSKLERVRRAVIEASKQCGRNRLMAVDPPVPWPDVLRLEPFDARIVAHPGGLVPALWPVRDARRALVAIGPEGGFTETEINAARDSGWAVVSLGPTLLRVETAAVAATSILLALSEG